MNTLPYKTKAAILQESLGTMNFVLNRGRALEVVAKMEGYANYRTLLGSTAAKPLKGQDSERKYLLPYGIEIECSIGEGGTLNSKLHEELTCDDANDELSKALANGSVNALESLLLALACAGVDLSTPEVATAIKTTVEKVANEVHW